MFWPTCRRWGLALASRMLVLSLALRVWRGARLSLPWRSGAFLGRSRSAGRDPYTPPHDTGSELMRHLLPPSTPSEAVASIRSGMRLFIHGAAATPTPLLQALCARSDLEGMRLYHLHLEGPVPFAEPALSERFRSISLFTSPALREAVAEG